MAVYNDGNQDPHQRGYMGQTLENRGVKTKAVKKRPKSFMRLGLTFSNTGTMPDYPQA